MRSSALPAIALVLTCGVAGASADGASQLPTAARSVTLPIRGQVVAAAPTIAKAGAGRRTVAATIDFCLSNSDKCALSVNHLSDGWERHFNADRLQATASTLKTLVLIGYAEAVANGRVASSDRSARSTIIPHKLMPRDTWARFWSSLDGGALAVAWEDLGRPSKVTPDQIARQMIAFSDNAAPDWFISELGDAAIQEVVDTYVNTAGHHDRPRPINAFFNTWVANPDEEDIGPRMLADYSGNDVGGYHNEVASVFDDMHKKRYMNRLRKVRCFAPPWKRAPAGCAPVFGTSDEEVTALTQSHFSRSTSRTYVNLMTRLLSGDLLADDVDAVVRRHLESVLELPNFSAVFSRYGRKGGSFGTNVLNWTAYMHSRETGAQIAFTMMLQNLVPGDIEAIDVILLAEGIARSTASAALVRDMMPVGPMLPEIVSQVGSVQSAARSGARRIDLTVEVEVINTSPHRARKQVEVAAYLSADSVFHKSRDVLISKAKAGKLGAYGRKVVTLSGATTVPVSDKFLLVVVDPNGKLEESVEDNNVAFQRIR